MDRGTRCYSSRSPQRTREAITIQYYLRPIVSLDNASLQKMKDLLKITSDLRRQTHHSQTRRIQRGSPGAGALGSTIAQFTPMVSDMASSIEEIATSHRSIPGMELIRLQFKILHDALNASFNDGGNEAGYYERVQFLEKLMYATGILRGHLESVIDQHAYWKAKLAGTRPRSIARRLNFNTEADPAESEAQAGVPLIMSAALQVQQGSAAVLQVQQGLRQLALTSPAPPQQGGQSPTAVPSLHSEATPEEKMSRELNSTRPVTACISKSPPLPPPPPPSPHTHTHTHYCYSTS